ncbi:LLM class flavin-dependent oxidoreductase [Shewanella metallivivens]|jgi:luciferase family oxidoreductase group 1|uniref:LLM class flavin-dependent oxidoreductase n=1 Tax=Shewanella metallivivens TaxID=2872342 RepID=A0ABT5TN99_9GAMM|nr:LLM class flavin-dependent oxidoreductase [Shewanella metallivivens]MDD8060084.1 LLM class flavin-dependent oxidoreductase [Shewanella metallivivens]
MSILADIPFSLLELAPMREDSTITDTLKGSLAYAQYAERVGVNRFWLAEHHNMPGIICSATSILIGYIAGGTERIRVGAGGIMLPNHAPLVVAEQFGTLASLYPGRIDLGLGRAPGSDPVTSLALNRDTQRAEHFPNEVSELQSLLGPREARQIGQAKAVRAIPGENTNVPIWLLGSSLFSAQLAAQRGLPYVFAGHFAPRFLSEAIALYRREFTPSAVLGKPYVMVGLPLVAAPTDAEAQYLSTTSKQRILALIRGQEMWLKPPVDSMDGLWSEQEKSYVDSFLSLSICGGPATIKHRLEVFVEQLGVDEVMFTNDLYSNEHRLRALDILMSIKS